MPEDPGNLEVIAAVCRDLEAAGHPGVLVGGMALVVYGSLRVTRDFDLLVSAAGQPLDALLEIAYRHGFELITKFDDVGEPKRSIDNVRIAILRASEAERDSLLFRNPRTGQRLDYLLDFPVAAADVLGRSTKFATDAGPIRIAVADDLIRMKKIAYADRRKATDAQDLEFLRTLTAKAPAHRAPPAVTPSRPGRRRARS